MTNLINIAVWAFALDAAISGTHELIGCADQCGALAGVRTGVAILAALLAQVLMVVWIISPRVPAAIALTTGAFTAWATLGAPPLMLLLAPDALSPTLTVAQGLLAVALIWLLRRRSGGRWWLRRSDMDDRRSTLWRALGLTTLATGASVVLVAVAIPTALVSSIEQTTAGYVSFSRDAVMLEQRRFEASDRATSVDLIGMMHLGERDTYDALFFSLTQEGTVVLTEGVTDQNSLLSGLSYHGLAQSLGLSQQPALEEVLTARRTEVDLPAEAAEGAPSPFSYIEPDTPELPPASEESTAEWPHIRHADVDAREFSPQTIAYLGLVGRTLRTRTMDDWMLLLSEEPPSSLDHDILQLRNESLLEALDDALREYSHVAVPWGALHLPEIEAWLLERGFELVAVERRPIVHYSTIWTKLRGRT